MAESKGNKNPKQQDNFADDLDSMLNLEQTDDAQVGLIDDDDAIDRLLVGDAFPEEDDNADSTDANDIDQLIAESVGNDVTLTAEIDEFGDDVDDIITGIQAASDSDGRDDIKLFDEADDSVDLGDLERVADIDDFADDTPVIAGSKIAPGLVEEDDELANMTEIDEFSNETEIMGNGNADFLLADFDISVDDHLDIADKAKFAAEPQTRLEQNEAEIEADSTQQEIEVEHEDSVADEFDEPSELSKPIPPSPEDALQQTVGRKFEPEPAAVKSVIDHSAALAGLGAQINDLKKQQTLIKQEIHLKPNKDELNPLLDSIELLKTEQKKTKRNFDTLINKKPVSAYVANAIAVVALIVGAGLGFQGYVAKLQVTQLVEYIGKLQEQIKSAPTADAAEKEMFKKQLDELALANSVTTNQIAELSKSVQVGDAGKPAGDVAKQLSELSQQDMQMGAAIEALQAKLEALEKGKVSSTPKPVAKKPPVIQEDWIVNLVAFKQDWYAKRKAEEFAAKGVPAKVSKTVSKGETWFRLMVDGFKTQYEAAAYAARVKKTLNLDSVWVAKNKN